MIFGTLCAATLAKTTWTLLLAGDVMLNGISPKTNPLEDIVSLVKAADIAAANLEIPLTRSRTLTSRKSAEEVKARKQFVLKADPSHADALSDTGFDLMAVANNHSMDYGPKGLAESLRLLEERDIAYSGAGSNWTDACEPAVVETEAGERIALVSFLAFITDKALRKCTPATTRNAGIAVLPLGGALNKKTRSRLKAVIELARKDSDFVIVALHWGVERETVPIPYQVNLGRALVDAGADVVWGHHPHVLQGSEIYRGKPILYSTGNLISAMPAKTALFQLAFDGNKLEGISAAPCRIANGKIARVSGKDADAEMKRIASLNEALHRRYPSKHSTVPDIAKL